MPDTAFCETMEYNLGGDGVWVAFDAGGPGEFSYEGGEITHHDAIAGQDNPTRPMTVPVGNVDTQLQLGELLLGYVLPAAACGLPSPIEGIQGGVIASLNAARRHNTCYIRHCEVACEEGGLVTVNYGWMGMDEDYTNIAAPAAVNGKGLIFLWHVTDIELEGDSYKCQRYSVTLENSLNAWRSMDAATPTEQRWPEGIRPGMVTIALSCDFRAPTGYDIMADLPARVTFYATAENELGDLFEMDCTGGYGFWGTAAPLAVQTGDEEVVYHFEGEADHNDLALWAPDITPA